MLKIKSKTKDYRTIVSVKTGSGEMNEQQLELFNRKSLRGFFRYVKKQRSRYEFEGPVGLSLTERLKKPVSKHDFFFIVEQMVDAEQKITRNGFFITQTQWNLNNIYINETTKELHFLYLPLTSNVPPVNMLDVISWVIYSAIPADEPDMNFVSDFVYFLNNLDSYDGNLIEQYIYKADRSVVNTIKKQLGGASGFITDKRAEYEAHYDAPSYNPVEDATTVLSEEEIPVMPAREEETSILSENMSMDNDMSDATTLLNEYDPSESYYDEPDDNETTLLSESMSVNTALSHPDNDYPYIVRRLNNEKVFISKPVFRIGKEKSYVDYFVSDNSAVSRSHADIIVKGNGIFVMDLNSKNKTYINGEPLVPRREYPLNDGDMLKIANEEYDFYLNK